MRICTKVSCATGQLASSSGSGAALELDWDLNRSVDALKRRLLVAAVREAGSKSGAAEKLGIPRQSLQKMMKRLQITDAELRESRTDTSEFDLA